MMCACFNGIIGKPSGVLLFIGVIRCAVEVNSVASNDSPSGYLREFPIQFQWQFGPISDVLCQVSLTPHKP